MSVLCPRYEPLDDRVMVYPNLIPSIVPETGTVLTGAIRRGEKGRRERRERPREREERSIKTFISGGEIPSIQRLGEFPFRGVVSLT